MKKHTLNLTTIEWNGENIPSFDFNSIDELTHKLNSFGKYPVALCCIKSKSDELDESMEILVSENFTTFRNFIESFYDDNLGEYLECWFYCYSSYEECYKNALDLKETNKLCYEK